MSAAVGQWRRRVTTWTPLPGDQPVGSGPFQVSRTPSGQRPVGRPSTSLAGSPAPSSKAMRRLPEPSNGVPGVKVSQVGSPFSRYWKVSWMPGGFHASSWTVCGVSPSTVSCAVLDAEVPSAVVQLGKRLTTVTAAVVPGPRSGSVELATSTVVGSGDQPTNSSDGGSRSVILPLTHSWTEQVNCRVKVTFSPGAAVGLSTVLVNEIAACAGGARAPLPSNEPASSAKCESK
ncbi:hypothetical protein AMK19_19550 [Kitasatospora sp. CB01950]|nr:hypothetical protein AMK19_19550 [Kitasatospora sp. CB01950]